MQADTVQEEQPLDLRPYLDIVLRWWWLLLLGPLVAGLTAYLISANQEPTYRASSLILVQQTGASAVPTLADLQTSAQLARTYERIITTRPVLEAVREKLSLSTSVEELRGRVSAKVVPNTQLLEIRIISANPVDAARIADALAEAFIQITQENRFAEIARLQQLATTQGVTDSRELLGAQLSALGSLTLTEQATDSDGNPLGQPTQVGPRTMANTVVGIGLGGFLSVLLALLLAYSQNTVQTPDRVERRYGLTNLGLVPQWGLKEADARGLSFWSSRRSHLAEAFRMARTNLQFVMAPNDLHALLVTSPGPQEGKTTVTANLAIALAQDGKRVTVVDADLRRPSLHKTFGLERTKGLSTYLADPAVTASEVVQPTEIEGLRMVASGPTPPNPVELLGSSRMQRLVEELRQEADIVLIDSPPLLAVADSVVLASQIPGVVLIVDTSKTRMEALTRSMEHLQRAGARPLGIIYNKLKLGRLHYGYSYYYYSYYYYGRNYYYGGDEDGRDGAKANGDGTVSRKRRTDGWLGKVAGRLARREER